MTHAKQLTLAILFSLSFGVYAELDPSSPLLRGRGSSPTIETLDSGRFTIKPTEEKKSSTGRSPRSNPSPPASLTQIQTESSTTEVIETKTKIESETVVESTQKQEESPEPQPEPSKESLSNQDLNLIERLRVLILGVNDQELEDLRSKNIKNSDGENSVEIYLAPSYFYYDSSSSYSVKEFSSSSPGYTVGLSLWFSPYFGLEGEMQSSLGASITSLEDNTISALKVAKNKIGLAFRRIDLDGPLTPQTLWRISYLDFSTQTSGSTGGRVSTKSSGLQIAFEAKLPSSLSYNHRLGVSIEPRLQHKESSGAQNIKSGESSTSSAISAYIGGEVKFSRKSEIYWNLQHRYERNLFKGAASYTDPETNTTPDGLNVDQGLTVFSIGYRWGK